MRAKTLERSPRLALWHSTNQRAADERSDRSQRRAEFIAVIEARAAVLGGEDIFGARARSRRAATLPHSQPARPAVDEPPVNFEVDAAHVYLLIHLESHPRWTLVGVHQVA